MSHSQTAETLRLDIDRQLSGCHNKYFTAPDGTTRRMNTHECGKNGLTTIYWNEGTRDRTTFDNATFALEWGKYTLAGKPVTAILAQTGGDVVDIMQSRVNGLLNISDIETKLRATMDGLSTDANVISKARAMNDLAKTIIEIKKLQLDALKVIRDMQ